MAMITANIVVWLILLFMVLPISAILLSDIIIAQIRQSSTQKLLDNIRWLVAVKTNSKISQELA